LPNISIFYGIIVYMRLDEHAPPHFHAKYGEYRAAFTMQGNLMKGSFPAKKKALIKAWAILHENELKDNWALINAGLAPRQIEPLR
jgi:hypothetical protein